MRFKAPAEGGAAAAAAAAASATTPAVPEAAMPRQQARDDCSRTQPQGKLEAEAAKVAGMDSSPDSPPHKPGVPSPGAAAMLAMKMNTGGKFGNVVKAAAAAEQRPLPSRSSGFGSGRAESEDKRDAASDDESPAGMGGRKGSYNQDLVPGIQGSARGRWWALQRAASFATAFGSKRDLQRARALAAKKNVRPEDLITAEQVRTYHELLQITRDIQGLHACVDHPCGNIYWDFNRNLCLPGRVWQDEMPEHIKAKIARDFTPEEVAEIEEAIHLHSAPSQPENIDPRALFLIGPAAAGKSAVRPKTEDMLQISLADYVEIDGDEFREKHKGWMDQLNSDPTTGYRDALSVMLPYTRKLKKQFLAHAIKHRKNIILPSTGSNFEKLVKEADSVRAKGYRVDVIGLVVSYHETRARALNRAHVNGRWNVVTWQKWEAAMNAIMHFMDPAMSDWCIVFDNHDFKNPTTIYTRTHNLAFVQSIVDEYRRMDQEKEQEQEDERKEHEASKQPIQPAITIDASASPL